MNTVNATRMGNVKKKVLLLLGAGFSLSLTLSPNKRSRIVKGAIKEWNEINRNTLQNAIRSLYDSQLVEECGNVDGSVTLVLSKEGERQVLTFKIDEIEIKKHKWDGKWRIITFDIPEKIKQVRDALRLHLKRLGFKELNKSVFVLPYECRKEIDYIIELHNVRRYVRYIEAIHIDNELDVRQAFEI